MDLRYIHDGLAFCDRVAAFLVPREEEFAPTPVLQYGVHLFESRQPHVAGGGRRGSTRLASALTLT